MGVPTSASVATACRLSEDSVTWSKSISLSLEHPERARAAVACDPTPPHPTTITKAFLSLAIPGSVRKTLFLASCSRMRSGALVRVELAFHERINTVVVVTFPCPCG